MFNPFWCAPVTGSDLTNHRYVFVTYYCSRVDDVAEFYSLLAAELHRNARFHGCRTASLSSGWTYFVVIDVGSRRLKAKSWEPQPFTLPNGRRDDASVVCETSANEEDTSDLVILRQLWWVHRQLSPTRTGFLPDVVTFGRWVGERKVRRPNGLACLHTIRMLHEIPDGLGQIVPNIVQYLEGSSSGSSRTMSPAQSFEKVADCDDLAEDQGVAVTDGSAWVSINSRTREGDGAAEVAT